MRMAAMARLLMPLFCVLLCTLVRADEWLPIKGVQTTYQVLQKGAEGAPLVKKGKTVTVHATGTVIETGKKFWSTKDEGQEPFTYTAGGGVIKGWDRGAMGMREGEIRLLKIPAEEGYGAAGFPSWGIPPNGGLHFEIEVLRFQDKKGEEPVAKTEEEPVKKTEDCETCQVLAMTLHEAVLSNLGKADMATKKKQKMSHNGLVTAVLDSPVCEGFAQMHGYIARRGNLDIKKMAKACVRLMDDRRDDFEKALLDPSTNGTSRQVRKQVCLSKQKRRKAYCSALWTEKEEPVPKTVIARQAAENGQKADVFFHRVKNMEGVKELPDGLFEKILRRGNGTVKPGINTSCTVHYRGMLLDCEVLPGAEPCVGGTEFDSTHSEDGHTKGKPANFNARLAKSFWEHALPRMVAGDWHEYYVPYVMAYGANDDPDKRPSAVGPNASLIFNVELLAVTPEKAKAKVEL